VLVDISGGQFL
jgi:hypothetical protein